MTLTGRGLITDPFRSLYGRCAYDGCDEQDGWLRMTNNGYAVSYCQKHCERANRLFGGWPEDVG